MEIKIPLFDLGKQIQGNDFWFELSGGARNIRVREIDILMSDN